MSTISLSYPNAIRKPRASNMGWIFILVSSILIASAVLVIVISANAELTDRLPISQNSIAAVPVPTPPLPEIQPVASGTPVPSSGQTSELSVVAVPVPTP